MKLVAKTLYGLEKVLEKELLSLGARDTVTGNRAVVFSANLETLYAVNYGSRTAMSVLMPISEFSISSSDDLYRRASGIAWEKYLNPDDTFSVVPVVNSDLFRHTGYAALVVKDAIADRFRNISGSRPSVDNADPAILINLHISHNRVTISLDSSGIPLYKRGYRVDQGLAPLNEVLAAGMIMMSGWDCAVPLSDPMCGSGTISVEAALLAGRIPPGRFRKSFGFMRWKNFDEELFSVVAERLNQAATPITASISAGDISEDAVESARRNIEAAGLADVVGVEVHDFMEMKLPEEEGIVFLNPPYEERIITGDPALFYGKMGTTLKHGFPGREVWLLTHNREALKHIGLKPREKHMLFNGQLEVLYLKYEMYRGSRKNVGENG
ncbi:MAG: THUMP domain-containing protein [Bacteroidales bacterium]|jgi:putative N6-adenine-specific DNA methylase|nr:THUMP domain-containing protein [Bacteroidales bacterium]